MSSSERPIVAKEFLWAMFCGVGLIGIGAARYTDSGYGGIAKAAGAACGRPSHLGVLLPLSQRGSCAARYSWAAMAAAGARANRVARVDRNDGNCAASRVHSLGRIAAPGSTSPKLPADNPRARHGRRADTSARWDKPGAPRPSSLPMGDQEVLEQGEGGLLVMGRDLRDASRLGLRGWTLVLGTIVGAPIFFFRFMVERRVWEAVVSALLFFLVVAVLGWARSDE